MSIRRISSLAVVVLFTVGIGWAVASSVKDTDPRLGACAEPVGNVRASFDLAHARDLWSHIPGFKGAPELEVDDPAHVVVYAGPVAIEIAGRARPNSTGGPPVFNHVVCVAIGGEPTYYSDVDLSVVTP